ncbi:hypothetical protein GS597_07485 [Synechococcales cyanobacterium C]|uniref:Uncharacterized protein n=1 Tax=Petrachloros mirabilis ULC683 TaxID=2781853 RepID=A0A8K2A7M5_9CYAN|nr:hypothetical protein [Petrachloros mirabilis]NCJ06354.1 hypothetical protein [Petrachloros mirabilis ULC683]
MTSTPDREPSLQDLANGLEQLRNEIKRLSSDLEQSQAWQGRFASDIEQSQKWQERFASDIEQSQKWQDRTWDVVKWVGGISAGLAIGAAIALVGIVLKQASG